MNVLKNITIGKPIKPLFISDYKNNSYKVLNSSNILIPSTFDSINSFSRVGGGGRFKEDGLFEWQSSGPRFDYDPVTFVSKGLLIERQATNLVATLFAGWSKITGGTGTVPVVTPNYSISPDGASNATRLECSRGLATDADRSQLLLTVNTGLSNPHPDTISVWAKSNTGSNQRLYFRNATGTGGTTILVTPVWQRFYFSHPAVANTNLQIQIGLRGISATADLSCDVSLWAAGAFTPDAAVTSTIPTTISSITRSGDYADLIFNPLIKTIILDHDIASGLPLLATGSNDLLISNGAGRSILAIDDSNIYTSHNGTAYTTTAKPAFDSTLKLLRNGADTQWANGHLAKLIAFPRKLSVSEAMAA